MANKTIRYLIFVLLNIIVPSASAAVEGIALGNMTTEINGVLWRNIPQTASAENLGPYTYMIKWERNSNDSVVARLKYRIDQRRGYMKVATCTPISSGPGPNIFMRNSSDGPYRANDVSCDLDIKYKGGAYMTQKVPFTIPYDQDVDQVDFRLKINGMSNDGDMSFLDTWVPGLHVCIVEYSKPLSPPLRDRDLVTSCKDYLVPLNQGGYAHPVVQTYVYIPSTVSLKPDTGGVLEFRVTTDVEYPEFGPYTLETRLTLLRADMNLCIDNGSSCNEMKVGNAITYRDTITETRLIDRKVRLRAVNQGEYGKKTATIQMDVTYI
ncbi:hypothetical protein OCE63_002753 [Salmonella enterica]|nr:hypothetical protein [Salmonella enterica]